MQTQRQNVTNLVITERNTQSKTSVNGRRNSETIPVDIIFEIFLRLPAKSIAICRCVSKFWASILVRPDFTELFLTKSYARPQLLISCARKGEELLFSAPQTQNPNDDSSIVAANYHNKFPVILSSETHGHVHGLVCLTVSKGWTRTMPVICNPSTGQSFPLPGGLKTVRTMVDSLIGYDPVDKQYKILSLAWPSQTPDSTAEKCKVLTLGTKKLSWRTVECFPHQPTSHGISINGVLYYIASVDKPRGDWKIACFDVRSEKCRFISMDKHMSFFYDSTLVNYKGKLGVLLTDIGIDVLTKINTCFELWVLVDTEKHQWSKNVYALPDSWKNVFGDFESSFKTEHMLYFVGVTDTNEVVLSPRYLSKPFYIFYYNLETKIVKRVEIQGMDACEGVVHIFLNHVEDVKLMQGF